MTAKNALVLSLCLLGAALVVGFGSRSWFGVLCALAATVPAAYGTWKGMQNETQGATAGGIVLLLAALAVTVVLVIARFF
jgi:hypothetical protein